MIRLIGGGFALAMLLSSVAAPADTIPIPLGSTAKPVPMTPPIDPKDTPEEIAKDAARDLGVSGFYNKPGATRADYDADWQTCRLIARGSSTPSGTMNVYYNPAVTSPLAAGIGGGIGAAIGMAIVEGQQRRANRRACLLIKGWRHVEPEATEQARITAMDAPHRAAYLDAQIGAASVAGAIVERTSFSPPSDPVIQPDTPLTMPGRLYRTAKASRTPLELGQGEAAVVLAFRRTDAATAGRRGFVELDRYDMATRDLYRQPIDWKKKGDATTYRLPVESGDRQAQYEVQIIKVTPGDYVIAMTAAGPVPAGGLNCFGAPTFHVDAGETVYLGDFMPYVNAKRADGNRYTGLVYTSHVEDARHALASEHLGFTDAMRPATLHNRATFACAAMVMDRWDLPGVDMLVDPAPVSPPAQKAGEAAAPNAVTAGATTG